MPPRGYRPPLNGGKPTLPAQFRTKIDAARSNVKKALIQLLDEKDPAITNNSTLQKQRVPDGWEPITSIPDWATAGTAGRPDMPRLRPPHKERINPETLSHAIRLKGTNHILTSEVKLTEAQLDRAAKHYAEATAAIGHQMPDGVAMHIPSASNFGSAKTRGFMRMSEGTRRTFYMSPRVIKQDDAAIEKLRENRQFTRNWNFGSAKARAKANGLPEPDINDPQFGWSMPAADKYDSTVYTMVHEMVHILDDMKSHTGDRGQASRVNATKAREFHKRVKPKLSEYGRSKVVEGYAEAGAQWFLAGPGTSDAADEYANEYGWEEASR
jgi:hypothetical protein